MKKADHPSTCEECHGTGWQPGPPIAGQHHGRTFTYTTVEPCTHHWANDDPNPDLFAQSELDQNRSR